MASIVEAALLDALTFLGAEDEPEYDMTDMSSEEWLLSALFDDTRIADAADILERNKLRATIRAALKYISDERERGNDV